MLLSSDTDVTSATSTSPQATSKKVWVFPPSSSQESLWMVQQLNPGSPAYNIPSVFQITGDLDVPALQEAFNGVVQRHEILRTTFSSKDGVLQQIVSPSLQLQLPVLDLSRSSGGGPEQEVTRIIDTEIRRPFDLAQGPLIRLLLLRLSDTQHILVFNIHHIIADGWSCEILARELASFYSARTTGHASPQPPLPVQFADYAVWERKQLQTGNLQAQLDYWKQNLSGALPVLQLPADRPRPARQSFRGATLPFAISASVTDALREFSRQERTSLFMTLLAAFKVLLHRYCDQTDLLLAAPVANRGREELEGLIGFFVNTVVFRTDASGNPTFREFLRRVRDVTSSAYVHANVPFEKVVKELAPDRDLSHNPIFQILFSLHNEPLKLHLPGLQCERRNVDNGTAKFDLFFELWEEGGGIEGCIEYSTDLFDRARVQRMAGHFHTLLRSILANADATISALPLLLREEKHQVLLDWNNTQVDYPTARCVHETVEAQAVATPNAIALEMEGETCTYRELNQRANHLAQRLLGLGVGSDTRVGILMERSMETLQAVLAVWKAGGACLPLDPSYPTERLAYMLHDAQADVVLTQKRLGDILKALLPSPTCRVLVVDEIHFPLEEKENPRSPASSENLAYVLYTSGSTGKPKGVAMHHRPLVNLVHWQCQNFRITAPARTVQFSPLNFDVSFQEILSTWASGGTLVLIQDATRRDPQSLLQALQEQRIERLFLPFIALQNLAETACETNQTPFSLREVITAGEALQVTPALVQFFQNLPQCSLENQYGPTECHVVTTFRLQGSPDLWPPLPPIGRPIANARVYLLDQHQQPVPMGVPGELCIGGICPARGYLNQPELTAQKFVSDPFSHIPGARIYRTGDIARYLPDGNIEFLGRRDHQVKVRGFRIELGDVESALVQHPSVKEVVAALLEEKPGKKELTGYVVLKEGESPTAADMRDFLKEQLPDYMIPSVFVSVDHFPLTPSGKVDRRALTSLQKTPLQASREHTAPQTKTEKLLAEIWAEAMEHDNIGIHDNFFDLGGHSLSVMKVVARVRHVFRLNVSMSTVFELPTIAQFAAYLDGESQ
jgi:surfactin family lipopeptide synthetase A